MRNSGCLGTFHVQPGRMKMRLFCGFSGGSGTWPLAQTPRSLVVPAPDRGPAPPSLSSLGGAGQGGKGGERGAAIWLRLSIVFSVERPFQEIDDMEIRFF